MEFLSISASAASSRCFDMPTSAMLLMAQMRCRLDLWPPMLRRATRTKTSLFLHGYNVNEQQARGTAESEMFKRFFWSGVKSEFLYGVTWERFCISIGVEL